MPSVAVPSLKSGVTVRPSGTALSSVTVKVIASPSSALASAIVTVALSSLVIVPVAVDVAVTLWVVPDTLRPTVNVSLASTSESSVVGTVKITLSPAVPSKSSAVVGAV